MLCITSWPKAFRLEHLANIVTDETLELYSSGEHPNLALFVKLTTVTVSLS